MIFPESSCPQEFLGSVRGTVRLVIFQLLGSFIITTLPSVKRTWVAMLWFIPLAFIFLKKLKQWTEGNHAWISRFSAVLLVVVALYLIIFEKF